MYNFIASAFDDVPNAFDLRASSAYLQTGHLIGVADSVVTTRNENSGVKSWCRADALVNEEPQK